MRKGKKKFTETKVGAFLSKAAPSILGIVGDVIPDAGILGVVKGLITKDTSINKEDKDTALKLIELDLIEMQEVTKRWQSDMLSDSWLSKNVRPMAIVFLTVVTAIFISLDGSTNFEVDDVWVDLLKTLLVTTYLAYFGSRGVEKIKNIKK